MKTKIVPFVQLTALASTTLLLSPIAAHAIGPNDQIITDAQAAGAPTLNDVCAIGDTANNTFLQDGTGTLIGYQTNASGIINFAILTADHVASDNDMNVNFGPGQAAGGYDLSMNAGGYVTFQNQDISILQASINPATLNAGQLAYLNLLEANMVHVAPYTPNTYSSFTQVGYGLGGVWNPALGVSGGYAAQSSPFTIQDARRFQNNTITAYNAPAAQTYGAYFEPTVNWKYLPKTLAGGGAAFGGDSGGPYFFSGSSTQSSNSLGNVTVNYSDYEEAIHVAGQTTYQTNAMTGVITAIKFVGNTGTGVPLLQTPAIPATDSYDWVEGYAGEQGANGLICLIPEPSSVALLALGACCCFARRGRKS
jgi:PEP-CTERM motif